MSSNIHLQWSAAPPSEHFRTGVSLHSHTLHSHETLDFIYHFVAQVPLLASVMRAGERRYRNFHGTDLDLSRGWWTPPIGARDAWVLEKSQIEGLDLTAFVSLTDHDDIAAPVSLQILDECRDVPVSVEWTVPFRSTFFHLGIHNLPSSKAQAIFAELEHYRRFPQEGRLGKLLTMLAARHEILVIFNHPLWDEKGISQTEHEAAASTFLRLFGDSIHALELNGLRPWRENRQVVGFAAAFGKPVISGGDRHVFEPNALINLTNAGTFAEFVEEVRSGWSDVLIMRHYREAYAVRIMHNFLDVLRTQEQHANGWRLWSDRVFYTCDDGCVRSLTELFGPNMPAPIRLMLGASQFASAPQIRRLLRGAFANQQEVAL